MNARGSWSPYPADGLLDGAPQRRAGPDAAPHAVGRAAPMQVPVEPSIAAPSDDVTVSASASPTSTATAAAAALAADRARRELLAGLSHALRTPLHQATGLVHLLDRAKAEADGPRFTTFLGYLDTSCRELRRRIDALLVHAHRCSAAPVVTTIEVRRFLSNLLDPLQPAAARRRLNLAWSCPPGLAAMADPGALQDALAALVDNAIVYTPEGGHVHVHARAVDGATLRIDVEDDGIGIAPADLPRLFVEFVRLPAAEARHPDGLGLGLAGCRRLVAAMGGRLEAASLPGRGSRFSISLPRQPGPSIAAGSTQRS